VLKDEAVLCSSLLFFPVNFMSIPCGIASVQSSFSCIVVQPINELAEFFVCSSLVVNQVRKPGRG